METNRWIRAKSAIPVIGGSLAYMHDPLTLMRQLYRSHGPVAPVAMPGPGPAAFILGPDACGAVLQNGDKAFVNGWELLVGPFFDRGLMLLDGAEHKQHRRILQQAFTRSRLAAYTAALHPAVAAELDTWQAAERFPAYSALKRLTLNLATQIFMGGHRIADPVELDRVNRAFIDCVQAAGAIMRVAVPGNKWHRATRGRATLDRFLTAQLPAARAAGGDDLFSVLTRVEDEDGTRFGDADVVNHMIFLLMAAHETTTSTVSTAMYYLGRHPDWQDRVRAEAAVLGPEPTVEQLSTLPDLDMVIKECQRLVAPVPVVARRAVKDTEVAGRHVQAGTRAFVCQQLSHYLPELWTGPEAFDPSRFSPHRAEERSHRFAWAPFGGGVHKCLGMAFSNLEARTVLAQILRRFRWSVPAHYTPPMSNVSLPYPKDGLPVDLLPMALIS
ncbi:cytochrome P450 [Asanoa ishikariensis]|uniref:Cytochrome P450 n=1 Tax=Asanoa ishikariensis TaxID=137265 RepID=A0A1H3UAM4_9ACTN|nr:cytochrome P450 [Asanoa ishikariensis]GIF63984.1 cytochrome P450 [Asanoa ishikariensis]SDZ59337.1 Cytochrome P450 [Asanoa ishikariensis]